MPLTAVFFDIGETLVDESRIWTNWADWLGVPRVTFMGVLGGLIARGEDHMGVLEHFRPGFDLAKEEAERVAVGLPNRIEAHDLYSDVRPCLKALKDSGYFVGVVGNQPRAAEEALRSFNLAADVIATSDSWGVTKPSAAFFERIVAEAGVAPEAIAYVGDRVDNDVIPARAAGLCTVFLRRGPWGHLQASRPEAAQAHLRIESLAELPERLAAVNQLPKNA